MKLKNLVIALALNWFTLIGSGHWYLKRRRRALIFILPWATGLGFLFYDLLLAFKSALHTPPVDDPAAQVLALTQGILPNLEPYFFGLFLLIALSSLDIIWIFLSQVEFHDRSMSKRLKIWRT